MRHGFRLALGVAIIFLPFFAVCLLLGWMSARGLIPKDLGNWVLLFPMAGIAAGLYLILYFARRKLLARFRARPLMTFEQWFEDHYAGEQVSREVAQQILTLVAQGIGRRVQPTQVLPSDRLDEDFTFSLCETAIDRGGLLSDPLDCITEELPEWFKGQTGRELDRDRAWATIDDLIRGVSARFGAS